MPCQLSLGAAIHIAFILRIDASLNEDSVRDPPRDAGAPYQVIVGSGGSPFDDTLGGSGASSTEPVPFLNTWDRYYAWALVQVHQSGAVSLSVQGFSDGASFNPATGVINSLTPSSSAPLSLLYSVSALQ